MGVESLDVVVNRVKRHEFANPQRHVAEEQRADFALVLPLFRLPCRWSEAVVHVDTVAEVLLLGKFYHLGGMAEVIGDRLLSEDVTSRFERLYCRFVVVGGVFVAAGCNADDIGFYVIEHFLCGGEVRHAEFFSRFTGKLRHSVANRNELRLIALGICTGMAMSDMSHADDCCTLHFLKTSIFFLII